MPCLLLLCRKGGRIMRSKYQIAYLLAIAVLICLSLSALAEPALQGIKIERISKYGNLELSISCSDFLSSGFAHGDIVSVILGDAAYDMPVCSNYQDVDHGNMVCRAYIDEAAGEDAVVLAINMGDLATAAGLAVKTGIEEEPGYRWDWLGEDSETMRVSIAMKEPGGYADEYAMRQLVRTHERTDYPLLTDEQYANFRMIATTGMGPGTLYRTSSPVNPELGRSAYADAALRKAGVRTVIYLADTAQAMQAYPDYQETAYANCSVIGLNLGGDVQTAAFETGLAQGLRFLIAHEGPYAVHCTEGKDRAGFVSAVLECLMGASAQEVIADYMTTYENYYGVEPGSECWQRIAESNIAATLASVFGVEDICAEGVDLSAQAKEYLTGKLKLTQDEVNRLILCLSGDLYMEL